jgi:hypothetical protein
MTSLETGKYTTDLAKSDAVIPLLRGKRGSR